MNKWLPLVVLFITFACGGKCQVGLSASPMKLQFNVLQGGTQRFNILLTNPDTGMVQVSASVADWRRDSMGNIRYAGPGTIPNSCSQWINILPATQFTLGPHESKQIMVTLQVPDTIVDTAANSMILFTQLNPAQMPSHEGVNILLTVRIGVQVFYSPPGINRKGIEIGNLTDSVFAVKDSTVDKRLLLTLNNTGNVETDGKVNFELHNLKTGEKITLPEQKFYTLPGAVYIVQESLPAGLKKGEYTATALVDYGPEYELKIGELQFSQR